MKQETVSESNKRLENDPEYQAMMANKRQVWNARAEMLRKDEEPLVEALSAVGWPPNVRQLDEQRSVYDLVHTSEPYPDLLETLTEHLTRPYHKKIKEGIARALAVKEAKGTRIPRVLMEELKKETDPNEGLNSYRWALIYVLKSIGDSDLNDDLQKLLKDDRYASVRLDLSQLANRCSRRKPRKAKSEE